ncbi:hypothetical protein TNCV_2773871 [Trichonephila clavipes]|nr:hypothetical protein TNCV_2773871 [Trichonephila clavipes]
MLTYFTMVVNLCRSNCPLPAYRGWHRAQGDVYHGGITPTSSRQTKDRRANRYINERLSLKSHPPGSVPLEYLDFCVRGKFGHLAQGNRGLIVVKGLRSAENL